MQKIIQRRLAAEAQTARRATKQGVLRQKDKRWEARQQANMRNMFQRQYVHEERKQRREDWECGPALAPRRDVGAAVERYGTIDSYAYNPIPIARTKKEPMLVGEGDRVVVLQGRDAGKIGIVQEADDSTDTVKVKGLNLVDFFVPEYMRQEDGDPSPIIPFPSPMHKDDVKLVHAVRDPKTGAFRDVVVDRLRIGENKRKESSRFVWGTNIEVPWPLKDKPQYTDYDDDTLLITVEEVTDRPYLLSPPMPPSVIDELRNKYSRFRTRHEPEYVAKKEAQDAAAGRMQLLSRTVSTPLMELSAKRKAEKAKTAKELTEKQLAMIGSIMAGGTPDAGQSV